MAIFTQVGDHHPARFGAAFFASSVTRVTFDMGTLSSPVWFP